MNYNNKLRKVAPDSLLASLLLAFLATAGLYYVNIMPALIDGLKASLGFTDVQAGMAGAANMYGAACGALLATMIVTRVNWRRAAIILLLSMIAIDFGSMTITSPHIMITVRALHGGVGGLLVGIAFSVIARTRRPERTFGMLLVIQDGLGGLGVMFLPQWVPHFGTAILFGALIAFSTVTLLMLPFLDDFARTASTTYSTQPAPTNALTSLLLSMTGVFLFQFSNMLLFAYIITLAKHFSLDPIHAAEVVGVSAWIGILGSILVVVIATRFSRVKLLLIALALTALGMWVLKFSANESWYVIANCGTAITWSFTIPYLLGMCAKLDRSGRAAAFGGFASKAGLATGPLLGGLIVSAGKFELLIDVAVISMIACMLVVLLPALMLDRSDSQQR